MPTHRGPDADTNLHGGVFFDERFGVNFPVCVVFEKTTTKKTGLNIGGEMMRDVGVQPNSSSPITNDVMSMIDENISTIHDEDKGNNDSCGDDVHPVYAEA